MADPPFGAGPHPEIPRTLEIILKATLTNANVADLKAAVEPALAGAVSCVVLDLTGVPTISSMGLSYLASVAERIVLRGGRIFAVGVDPKVKVILNALGLVALMELCPSLEAAHHGVFATLAALRQQPRLLVHSGPAEGAEFPITTSPLAVGSDPECAISVRSPKIERRHAEIRLEGTRCVVKDLGSRSGTFVGNAKVAEHDLQPGEIIRIAELELQFLAPGIAPPTRALPAPM